MRGARQKAPGTTVAANGCPDLDGDGIDDYDDTDDDGDGVIDVWDYCPMTPLGATVLANGCMDDEVHPGGLPGGYIPPGSLPGEGIAWDELCICWHSTYVDPKHCSEADRTADPRCGCCECCGV